MNKEVDLSSSNGVSSFFGRPKNSACNSDLFVSKKFCDKFLRNLENVDFKRQGSKLVTELLRVGDGCIEHAVDVRNILTTSKLDKEELIKFGFSMERILSLLVGYIRVQDEVMSGISGDLSRIRSDVSNVGSHINENTDCGKYDQRGVPDNRIDKKLYMNSDSAIDLKIPCISDKSTFKSGNLADVLNKQKNSCNILGKRKNNRKPAERKIIIKKKKVVVETNINSCNLNGANSSVDPANVVNLNRHKLEAVGKGSSLNASACVNTYESVISSKVALVRPTNTFENLEVGVEISDAEIGVIEKKKGLDLNKCKSLRNSKKLADIISGKKKIAKKKKYRVLYIKGFDSFEVPHKSVWIDFFKIKSLDLIYAKAISSNVRELLINVNVVGNVITMLKTYLPDAEIVTDRDEVVRQLSCSGLLNIYNRLNQVEKSWNLFYVLKEIKILREMLISVDLESIVKCCCYNDLLYNLQVKESKSPGLDKIWE